jgi:hypothetical protein
MKIKQNDIVKFINCEPQVAGRVIEFRGDNNVLVRWSDGITTEHLIDELKLVRLEEFSGPWLGF